MLSLRQSSETPSEGAKGLERKSSSIVSGLSRANSARPTGVKNKRRRPRNGMGQPGLPLTASNLILIRWKSPGPMRIDGSVVGTRVFSVEARGVRSHVSTVG